MGQRSLTDADVEAIVEALKPHSKCNVGLSEEQAKSLKILVDAELTPQEAQLAKSVLRALNKTASIIGTLVIVAIAGGAIALFTRGFWVSMASGIKSAVPK